MEKIGYLRNNCLILKLGGSCDPLMSNFHPFELGDIGIFGGSNLTTLTVKPSCLRHGMILVSRVFVLSVMPVIHFQRVSVLSYLERHELHCS